MNLKIEKGIVEKMGKYVSDPDKAFERYNEILNMIKGDDIAENLLVHLVNAACEYVSIVCRNETAMKVQAYRLEGDDYRRFVESLDLRRKSSHDALISALHSFNRYIVKEFEETPIGGIYSFDPLTIRNRIAVGNWAVNLVVGIFKKRSSPFSPFSAV